MTTTKTGWKGGRGLERLQGRVQLAECNAGRYIEERKGEERRGERNSTPHNGVSTQSTTEKLLVAYLVK